MGLRIPGDRIGSRHGPVTLSANLDITWLRDPSLDDADNLPAPEVLAAEIVEDLQTALEEFAAIAETLQQARNTDTAP